MQRLIAIGLLVLVFLLGGAYSGYRTIKQNRPQPMWVPIPVNPDAPLMERDMAVRRILEKVKQPAVLERISHELNLPEKLELPDHKSVVNELTHTLFVRVGDMDTPNGKVPAIHVGVTGKSKNSKLSGEIAMRMMDDVWPLLGISPPEKR